MSAEYMDRILPQSDFDGTKFDGPTPVGTDAIENRQAEHLRPTFSLAHILSQVFTRLHLRRAPLLVVLDRLQVLLLHAAAFRWCRAPGRGGHRKAVDRTQRRHVVYGPQLGRRSSYRLLHWLLEYMSFQTHHT